MQCIPLYFIYTSFRVYLLLIIIKIKLNLRMSVAKMGINGFGRIGRLVFRSAFTQNANNARVMAINDPFMDKDYLIYLLSYDSVHGIYFNFLKYFCHRSF